jgi:putative tricarboxylic transport membrane protein
MTESATATGPATRQDGSGLGDLVTGLVATGFGIAVVVHVSGFPRLPDGAPGPALFPGILGALFVLFGSVLVLRGIRQRRAPTVQAAPPGQRGRWAPALAVVGAVVFYLLLSEVLGFSLTMALLLFGLSWLLGARPLVAGVSAVITTAVLYALFQQLLLVPLPTGPFG